METVVLSIHLLLALTLIIVVLLQRSEGGGLGIGGGGGGGVMSGRSAATALSKVTWFCGVAFVVTSLALTVIAARQDGSASVLDRIGGVDVDAPATDGDAGPLGGDLLPPVTPPAQDAPATPPALDGPATPPPAN